MEPESSRVADLAKDTPAVCAGVNHAALDGKFEFPQHLSISVC
jgi:hypothetical protein